MGYSVHYHDAAGVAKLDDLESLDAALQRVEGLRNEDGATDVRVFREVPVEVRTYYKVVAAEPEDRAGERRSEPPPGAMPLSPPPVTVRHEALDDETEATDDEAADSRHRPSLFTR